MKAFARIGDYPGRAELYISAAAEYITKDYEYVRLTARGQYIIITPCGKDDPGAVRMRKKNQHTHTAKTVCCTDLFSSGAVSKYWQNKRLPLKKMTKGGITSLVVCLEESGVV